MLYCVAGALAHSQQVQYRRNFFMAYNYGFQPNRPIGYRVVPVSSEMETNNITVDFNGNPTYFHNQNLNEIYVKQFDLKTGLTTSQKYVKADNVQADLNEVKPQIDTSLYDEKFNAMNDRINSLYELIENKGGKK